VSTEEEREDNDAVNEDTGAAGNAGAAPEASLRDRILDYLKGQIGGAEQDVLLSTKIIADALGTSANNVTYHVGRLVHAGHITTRSAGPQGTRFRLGGAPQVSGSDRRRRSPRRDAPVAAQAAAAEPTPAGAKGATNFCPYCGSRILADDWLFCASCGRPLGR